MRKIYNQKNNKKERESRKDMCVTPDYSVVAFQQGIRVDARIVLTSSLLANIDFRSLLESNFPGRN